MDLWWWWLIHQQQRWQTWRYSAILVRILSEDAGMMAAMVTVGQSEGVVIIRDARATRLSTFRPHRSPRGQLMHPWSMQYPWFAFPLLFVVTVQ